ncbi:Hypothetical protein, putative [Bodo saltans]|uniref:Leucine-rich repeat protein n=1 Tax=Bodo saltans TaxID=75058 RepID=A0A0S4KE43_BODSA|nr:Hypothetical protein, putative [Bodo saltans]|eukprot:CUI12713.1 Hypothetical protein, putative [Bodo saltans]
MKLTPLLEIVELQLQRDRFESGVAECADKINEQRLKLQRAQRDVTDYSGRLKYGGKGGLNPADIVGLQEKESVAQKAAADASKLVHDLDSQTKSNADELHRVKQQIDSLMNQLKMRYCVQTLSGSARASKPSGRDEDGGGSKQPIAASFAENIYLITDQLRALIAGGGKHPFLKLFLNDPPPVNDAAPHFTAWEQRTLSLIFNAKEKVQKCFQLLTDAVNAVCAYYPDLAKNVPLWTEFVDMCDDSFIGALGDNIDRALSSYERAVGGKTAPELFSVNLKLSQACRVQLVPTAHDLPNQLVSLIEDKMFSVVPSNTLGDVSTMPTQHKTGKGAYAKKLLADKEIAARLERIKNHVARFGEELVAAVVKVEDKFMAFWIPDSVSQMTLEELRAARDMVDFEFGFVRQRIYGGAFQLNSFPLQDTLSSLLSSQIDVKRQEEANTSDEVVREMIRIASLSNARTSTVPAGGLATILRVKSSNKHPHPRDTADEEWSERFDPVKYVEQLVAVQVKAANVTTAVPATQRSVAPIKSITASADVAAPVSSRISSNVEHAKEIKELKETRDNIPIPSSQQHSSPPPLNSKPLENLVALSVQKNISPRPSSTPSNGLRTSTVANQLYSLTPNRIPASSNKQPHSPSPRDSASTTTEAGVYNSRSVEVLKPSTSTSQRAPDVASAAPRSTAWSSPSPKVEKQRPEIEISERPPREPSHAPVNPLLSPFREKQATPTSAAPPNPERELFDATTEREEPSRRPRSILKGNVQSDTPPIRSPRIPAPVSEPSERVDDDEYTLQNLLQKEKESLERIRLMKEKDEARRREIQAAHRREVVTEETLRKVSPRSEYQALLEEQSRLDTARRENEVKLREAEKEARRMRDEQEFQRQSQLHDEERQQKLWEEQLRHQHEENARRRTREKQAAEEAEREALRKKIEEEEKRKQYQRELEDRLEDELRRRALQQQKEREERENERIRREHELHREQEGERNRQRAALERMRHSPVPQEASFHETGLESDHNSSNYLPSVADPSALRRKLALPPVQGALGDRPSTPTSSAAPLLPEVPSSARNRKPNTAPLGTPRGLNGSARSTSDMTPRDRMNPIPTTGPLPEVSLLDEYKQYCLNFGIKPNSGLLKSLPSVVGDFATTINLDLNYIGVKGVQPLLQILRRNRGLRLLNLKDNNLENNEVRALVNVLLTDSGNTLTHLDLSNNPISLAGGSAIMDLVSQKKSLTTVVLRGTLIQPKVVEKIVEAAESNRRRAAWGDE